MFYTANALYAPGRTVIDAAGNAWSGNNWVPGTTTPSTQATALNPLGSPLSISPVSGGGLEGPAWGTAVAPNGSLWFTSFGGNAVAEFASNGIPLSPSSGWSNGGINHPQGVAVDQKGNIWIANSFGPTSAPGQGDVVVYPDGNPAKAITITGGGLNHPFAIQIDSDGRAWVDNAGLGGAKLVGTKAAVLIGKASGSVTVIGSNFKPTSFSPIQSSSFKFPLGLALDSAGNSWVVSFDNSSVIEIHPSGTVAERYISPAPCCHGRMPSTAPTGYGYRLHPAGGLAPLRREHRGLPSGFIDR